MINQIKALYRGELFEKTKRNILKKTHLINFTYKMSNNIEYKFRNYFNINKENIKSLSIPKFEEIKLMNKDIKIKNIKFNESKNLKKWYYTQLPKNTDIKFLWEINRLQFLPLLSLRYIKTEDKDDLKKIIEIIKKWKKQNPYNYGINWYSNLEVAIRSISILFTYIIIYDNYKSKVIEELLFQHAYHIYKNISYTERCIPNNHVIGEATALYMLGNIFQSDYSNKWILKSKKILKKYIYFFREDGTFLEGSLSYQRFVLQMYLMVYLFSKKFGDDFIIDKLENIFSNSYRFLKTIEKPDGSYPQFGDWDDGVFYNLDFEEITNYKTFVDTLGYFFAISKKTFQGVVLESVFGKIRINKNVKVNNKNIFLFEKGKYAVIKDNNNYIFVNNQDQIFHSHSDGLSVEIVINGRNITLDSGTYSYNLNRKLRKYFRSSKAHNTVFFNHDQAMQIGTFRWIDKPENSLWIKCNRNLYVIIGILKTKKKDKLFRKIIYNRENEDIIIVDKVESNEFEINWHFSPNIIIRKITDYNFLINENLNLFEVSKDKIDTLLEKSKYSPTYNVLIERYKLKIKKNNKKLKNTIITLFTKKNKLDIEYINTIIERLEE